MDPDFRKQLRQVTRKVRGQMYEQLNEEVDILEDENEALQELIEEERNEAFKELCQSKAEYRALNKGNIICFDTILNLIICVLMFIL